MTVGIIQDDIYRRHLTGANPERPDRVVSIHDRLTESGLAGEVVMAAPRAATVEDLSRVHDLQFIEHVAKVCRSGASVVDSPDTTVCPISFEVALQAAGAGLVAADHVMAGRWGQAFAAVRPPGHHAEHALAMGFCLFNNVAVLARYLQVTHRVERVLILDWDVHHGNGTQHTFEDDPSVYFISLHQYPFYPGTGAGHERGVGAGAGTTLNCPMDWGTGDDVYLSVFEKTVCPAIEAFEPQFILVSAGFDAHRRDPLGGLSLTVRAYREMSVSVLDLAQRHCQGRLISLLEGGYDLDALADCVETHVGVLVDH